MPNTQGEVSIAIGGAKCYSVVGVTCLDIYRTQCPPNGGRIGNRVQITSGTAAVSANKDGSGEEPVIGDTREDDPPMREPEDLLCIANTLPNGFFGRTLWRKRAVAGVSLWYSRRGFSVEER